MPLSSCRCAATFATVLVFAAPVSPVMAQVDFVGARYFRIGERGHVEIEKSKGVLDLNGEFTIEAWVRLSKDIKTRRDQREFYLAGDEAWKTMSTEVPVTRACGWVLRAGELVSGKRALEFTIATEGGPEWTGVKSAPVEFGNTWHHVAVCRSKQVIKIHVDGIMRGEDAVKGTAYVPAPTNVFLGARKFGWENRRFYGDIGGFRLSRGVRYEPVAVNDRLKKFDPPVIFKHDKDTVLVVDFARQDPRAVLWPTPETAQGSVYWLDESPARQTGGVTRLANASAGRVRYAHIHGRGVAEVLDSRDKLNLNKPFTIETWFRLNHAADGPMCIAGNDAWKGMHFELPVARACGWVLRTGSVVQGNKRTLDFTIGVQDGTKDTEWFSVISQPISLGSPASWHHLAVCRAENALQLYFDGQLCAEKPCQGLKFASAPLNVFLGTSRFTPMDRNLEGDLGGFRLSSIVRYDKPFEPKHIFGTDSSTVLAVDFTAERPPGVELTGSALGNADWVSQLHDFKAPAPGSLQEMRLRIEELERELRDKERLPPRKTEDRKPDNAPKQPALPGKVERVTGPTIEFASSVDGCQLLIIDARGATWQHRSRTFPSNTVINGIVWDLRHVTLPNSGDTKFLHVPVDFSKAKLQVLEGRDTVAMTRAADRVTVYINDTPAGAGLYRFRITFDDVADVKPVQPGQLGTLRIRARIDGSDMLHLTQKEARWQHKHWGVASNVSLGAVAWDTAKQETLPNQGKTQYLPENVDFRTVRVTQKAGRDPVFVVPHASGLTIYFADNLVGAHDYEVLLTFGDEPSAAGKEKAAPIQILAAFYGANVSWLDVTDKVASAVAGKTQWTMRVTNDNLGDPAPGYEGALSLLIRYSLNGSIRLKSAYRGEEIRLP